MFYYYGGATPSCFFFEHFATLLAEKQLATVVLGNQLFSPDLRVLICCFALAFDSRFCSCFTVLVFMWFTACTLPLHTTSNVHGLVKLLLSRKTSVPNPASLIWIFEKSLALGPFSHHWRQLAPLFLKVI